MIPQFPPVWADVFGEDDFGIFAECEVKGARFERERWMIELRGEPTPSDGGLAGSLAF